MQYTYPAYTTTEDRKRKSRDNVLPILAGVAGLAGLGAGAYLLSKSLKSPSGTGSLGGGGGAGIGARPDVTTVSTTLNQPHTKIIPITSDAVKELPPNTEGYRRALHALDTSPIAQSKYIQATKNTTTGTLQLKGVEPPEFARLQNLRDNQALLRARLKLIQEQHSRNVDEGISSASRNLVQLPKTDIKEGIRNAERRFIRAQVANPDNISKELESLIDQLPNTDTQNALKQQLKTKLVERDFEGVLKELRRPNVRYSPTATASDIKQILRDAAQELEQKKAAQGSSPNPKLPKLPTADGTVIDVQAKVVESNAPIVFQDEYARKLLDRIQAQNTDLGRIVREGMQNLPEPDKNQVMRKLADRFALDEAIPIARSSLEREARRALAEGQQTDDLTQRLLQRAARRENKIGIATEIMRAAEQTRDDRIRMLYDAALAQGTIDKIAELRGAQDTTLVGKLQQAGQKISESIGISPQNTNLSSIKLTSDDVKQIVRAELDDALYRAVRQSDSPFNIQQNPMYAGIKRYNDVIQYLNRQVARTSGTAKQVYQTYLDALTSAIDELEATKIGFNIQRNIDPARLDEINTAISRQVQELAGFQKRYLDSVGSAVQLQDIGVEDYIRGVIQNNRALSRAARQPEASIAPISAIALTRPTKTEKAAEEIRQLGVLGGTKKFIQGEVAQAEKIVENLGDTAKRAASEAISEVGKQAKQVAGRIGLTKSAPVPLSEIMKAENYQITENPMYYVSREGLNPELKRIAMERILGGGDTSLSVELVNPEGSPAQLNVGTVNLQDAKNIITPQGLGAIKDSEIVKNTPIIDSITTQGGQRVLMLRYKNPYETERRRNLYRLQYFSAPTKTLAKFGVV